MRTGLFIFLVLAFAAMLPARAAAPAAQTKPNILWLIGENLSLSYRFPKELLSGWRALDAAVLATSAGFLKTAR